MGMFHDIFVGVMIVIAIGAGIWCWWFENFDTDKKKKVDDKKEKRGGMQE